MEDNIDLVLTNEQKDWLKKLKADGCNIVIESKIINMKDLSDIGQGGKNISHDAKSKELTGNTLLLISSLLFVVGSFVLKIVISSMISIIDIDVAHWIFYTYLAISSIYFLYICIRYLFIRLEKFIVKLSIWIGIPSNFYDCYIASIGWRREIRLNVGVKTNYWKQSFLYMLNNIYGMFVMFFVLGLTVIVALFISFGLDAVNIIQNPNILFQ